MFCDEPTTGLDSFNALNVIKSMRSLTKGATASSHEVTSGEYIPIAENGADAKVQTDEMEMYLKTTNRRNNMTGKAIMCSIHHPTSELFKIFTHVILMYSGSIAFQGTLDEVQQFFVGYVDAIYEYSHVVPYILFLCGGQLLHCRQGFRCPVSYNPAEYYVQVVSKEGGRNRSLRQAMESARDAYAPIKAVESKASYSSMAGDNEM